MNLILLNKKGGKLFLPFFFLIILTIIPLAIADYGYGGSDEETSIGTFKQYECVNLIQVCSNCTFVNITGVLYPNSTLALGEDAMTQNGVFYNYTFCNTTDPGTYLVSGYGDLDGELNVWRYSFTITPAGGIENNTLFFLVLIALAIIFFLLANTTDDIVFMIIAGFAWLGAGLYGMIYGFGNLTNFYTRMISYIVIGLGAIIVLISSLNMIRQNSGRDED